MEQSTATMRDFTLEEAMSLAIRLHKNEQFAEAEDVYGRILELVPDHPDVLHFSGILAHQQGKSEQAIALIEKSLAIVPDQADCYSNLGNIFQARGRLEEGIAAYQRAIVPSPPMAANVSKKPQAVSAATRRWMATMRGMAGMVAISPGPVLTILSLYLNGRLRLTQAEVNQLAWIPPLTWGIGYFFWGWAADRYASDNPRPVGLFLLLTAMALPLGLTTCTSSLPLVMLSMKPRSFSRSA